VEVTGGETTRFYDTPGKKKNFQKVILSRANLKAGERY
jgi:hypothetical protein